MNIYLYVYIYADDYLDKLIRSFVIFHYVYKYGFYI